MKKMKIVLALAAIALLAFGGVAVAKKLNAVDEAKKEEAPAAEAADAGAAPQGEGEGEQTPAEAPAAAPAEAPAAAPAQK